MALPGRSTAAPASRQESALAAPRRSRPGKDASHGRPPSTADHGNGQPPSRRRDRAQPTRRRASAGAHVPRQRGTPTATATDAARSPATAPHRRTPAGAACNGHMPHTDREPRAPVASAGRPARRRRATSADRGAARGGARGRHAPRARAAREQEQQRARRDRRPSRDRPAARVRGPAACATLPARAVARRLRSCIVIGAVLLALIDDPAAAGSAPRAPHADADGGHEVTNPPPSQLRDSSPERARQRPPRPTTSQRRASQVRDARPRRFMTGYLPYIYGRGAATDITDATPASCIARLEQIRRARAATRPADAARWWPCASRMRRRRARGGRWRWSTTASRATCSALELVRTAADGWRVTDVGPG